MYTFCFPCNESEIEKAAIILLEECISAGQISAHHSTNALFIICCAYNKGKMLFYFRFPEHCKLSLLNSFNKTRTFLSFLPMRFCSTVTSIQLSFFLHSKHRLQLFSSVSIAEDILQTIITEREKHKFTMLNNTHWGVQMYAALHWCCPWYHACSIAG